MINAFNKGDTWFNNVSDDALIIIVLSVLVNLQNILRKERPNVQIFSSLIILILSDQM